MEADDEIIYETWEERVPGALPAELVTGNASGLAMKITAASAERKIAVTMDHSTENSSVFRPSRFFIREATPDENVISTTGIVMNTPKLMRYDEIEEKISEAGPDAPKSSDAESPRRTAAI